MFGRTIGSSGPMLRWTLGISVTSRTDVLCIAVSRSTGLCVCCVCGLSSVLPTWKLPKEFVSYIDAQLGSDCLT